MSIELNKKLIKANSQTIEISQAFVDFTIPKVEVVFAVLNEGGEFVDEYRLNYEGQEAEDFWANWDSKKFMYEKLVEEKELDVVVPEISDNLKEE